jgi:hypothetical protein
MREMNEIRIIKKMAQITILFHLLDRLCNGELPEAGRKAVRSLIAQLNKETLSLLTLYPSALGSSGPISILLGVAFQYKPVSSPLNN